MIGDAYQMPAADGIERFKAFGSTAGTGVTFNLKGTAITDELEKPLRWFAFLPGSWFGYRHISAGSGAINVLGYRRQENGSNTPGVTLAYRGFLGGENTDVKANLQANEFAYGNPPDHFAQLLPFAGKLFAPQEFLYWTWQGSGNSTVYSLDWATHPDPAVLAAFIGRQS